MSAGRTERSAMLALILAVVVLLVSSEGGSSVAAVLAGALFGGGTVLALVEAKPEWFTVRRARSVAREKCDEVRDLLVAEMRALEQAERAPIPPIRMRAPDEGEADSGEARKAA